MNKKRLALGGAAALAAAALALTGCSSGGGSTPSSSAAAGSLVTVENNEPQHGLIPAITNEVGGGLVLQNIFAMPIYYDADGGLQYDAAESIESDDNVTWTIKLKADQTFSDGTPVTSDSFIKAWQYAASDPEFENEWWFANFKGYEEGENSLALEKIDDTTFTVELAAPQADFPLSLGYPVFAPLPDSFFDDPDAFGEAPIGNGPYKVESWTHDQDIVLVPNDSYTGPRKPQNAGIDLIAYSDLGAAYTDVLADNLDITKSVPDTAYQTFESDLGDRAVNQPAAVWQGLTIPQNLAHFSGEEGNLRRQAISYAIDRDTITQQIFNGTRTPAVDFTSPVISGWSDDIPGSEVTKYDPDKAKQLWAQADAISPWDGQFKIAYNADGGHQPWVDAVANGLKNVLGIDAAGVSYPDFATLRTEIKNRTVGAATRAGWQFDYPAPYNILGALFITGAGSNDGDYSNPEYDDLVTKGATADSLEESNQYFEQAQEVLFKDLPVLPLWYSNATAAYSTKVSNVVFGWDSWPILYQVTKSE